MDGLFGLDGTSSDKRCDGGAKYEYSDFITYNYSGRCMEHHDYLHKCAFPWVRLLYYALYTQHINCAHLIVRKPIECNAPTCSLVVDHFPQVAFSEGAFMISNR